MDEKKDELIFVRHIGELARSAYYKGINVYSNFCGLKEQGLILRESFPVPYSFYGGFSDAERVKIGFHGKVSGSGKIAPDDFIRDYPISRIKISPLNTKFAEELTHRDYLGAILNLGIDRSMTGDILPASNAVYLCCDEMIANFLCENLTRVRHTSVQAVLAEKMEDEVKRSYEQILANVASLRLDAVVGAAFHMARGSVAGMISGGKVVVNGREILQGSSPLKEGDIVSVRGFGKFRYVRESGTTKKGRFNIILEKYR